MSSFKTLTDIIIAWYEANDVVQEVTFGDINEVDLSTHTDFPLAHIIPLTSEPQQSFTTYNYQILVVDKFTESSEEKIEVLDIMADVVEKFTSAIYEGSLFNQRIRVSTAPTSDVAYDILQNRLYGWSVTVSLLVPANITDCG